MIWAGVVAMLEWYGVFILLFFFTINSYYLVLTVAGFWRTLQVFREVRRLDQRILLRSPLPPPDLGARACFQRRGERRRQCALAAHARLPAV